MQKWKCMECGNEFECANEEEADELQKLHMQLTGHSGVFWVRVK